ncbi:hypothetical protein Syun_029630 [Stephania yunnanensis]|uniref:Uncharacterized protein n=1 Tax=Stephania yunnanensis TaxID=152371 RepID=A0AAP0E5Z4_9MAGN
MQQAFRYNVGHIFQFASLPSSSLLPMRSSVKVEVQVDDMSHPGVDFKSCSPSEGLIHNEKLQNDLNYLKPKDMKECLTKVFGLGSVTSIYYLDETAAFVQFNKEELVSDFLTLKETLEKATDVISVVRLLTKLLEGGKTRAAPYEVYKEIFSSSPLQILFVKHAETVNGQWKIRKVEFEHKSGSEESCEDMQYTSRYHLLFELIDACTDGS